MLICLVYIDKSYPSLSLYLYVELKSSQLSGKALKKYSCNSLDCGLFNNFLYVLLSSAVSIGKYCAVAAESSVTNNNSVRKIRFIRLIVSKNILLGIYIYFYSIMSVVVKKIKKFFCFFLGFPNIVKITMQNYRTAFSARLLNCHSKQIYRTEMPLSIVIGGNLFLFHII